MGVGEKKSLGMAILSWKAPRTVEMTLKNYSEAPNFLSLFDDKKVYFQEISDSDVEVAVASGFAYEGNQENRGILGGFEAALRAVACDYVLMLENDCPIAVSDESACLQIKRAVSDMMENGIKVCRLRHRVMFGEKFQDQDKFLQFYSSSDMETTGAAQLSRFLRRTFRPWKAERMKGRAAYAEQAPERHFPEAWSRLPSGNLLSDSRYVNWTNQSILVERQWCLDFLLPWVKQHPSRRQVYGFSDIEKELNGRWWRSQRLPLLVSDPGIFTHQRLDR